MANSDLPLELPFLYLGGNQSRCLPMKNLFRVGSHYILEVAITWISACIELRMVKCFEIQPYNFFLLQRILRHGTLEKANVFIFFLRGHKSVFS